MALLEVLRELLEHRLEARILVVVGPHRQRGRRRLPPRVRAGRDGGEQREGDEDEHSQQAPVHIPSSATGRRPGGGYETIERWQRRTETAVRGRRASGSTWAGRRSPPAVVETSSGAVLERRRVATGPERGGAAVLADCAALAAELGGGRLPVGIALCELVDLDGRPASGDTVDWRGLDVEAAVGAPSVVVESDVRAAALAEARFGVGRRGVAVPPRRRRDRARAPASCRRAPVRRRARRGARARCAAGRAHGERACARPRRRARARGGRPRGSGARGDPRRRGGRSWGRARHARQRARPGARRPRRGAGNGSPPSGNGSSGRSGSAWRTRASRRSRSSAPSSAPTAAWSGRPSWRRTSPVRLARCSTRRGSGAMWSSCRRRFGRRWRRTSRRSPRSSRPTASGGSSRAGTAPRTTSPWRSGSPRWSPGRARSSWPFRAACSPAARSHGGRATSSSRSPPPASSATSSRRSTAAHRSRTGP